MARIEPDIIVDVKRLSDATQLARFLNRIALGGGIIITIAGKKVAKLVPFASERFKAERPRFKLGSAKGAFIVPDDFIDPLPKEIEDLFW